MLETETLAPATPARRGRPARHISPAEVLQVKRILEAVCAARGVRVEEMRGDSRGLGRVWRARQEAMFLARKLTPATCELIGGVFRRDHSTVVNGVRKIARAVDGNPAYFRELMAIGAKVAP